LTQISAERLREQFAQAALHTVAEGARMDIETAHDTMHRWARHVLLENVEIAD